LKIPDILHEIEKGTKTMTREQFEQKMAPEQEKHNRLAKLLSEFLNINQISPADALSLLANSMIQICEGFFNKEVFLSLLHSMKQSWDKDRE
jgi:hypothetical protein